MKITKYIVPLFFTILGLLAYSNILYAPFVLDDEWFITRNYQIRDLSNFLKDFSGTRYIGLLSFAINYYFGGLNTFGYHLVNIVIHILNAILVYFLIILTLAALKTTNYELRTPNLIAFAISLIFLVHPIQTQAVTYITQRFTSLATLFYLLAIVLYIKARINTMLNFKCLMLNNSKFKIKHLTLYFLSLLSAVLAMKTKEISFTLPLIILFYEFTFFDSRLTNIKSRLLYLIPYFLTLIIIPLDLLFSTVSGSAARELQSNLHDGMGISTFLSSYNHLLTHFNVVITYIRLLLFPVNQNLLYDYPLSNSIFEPTTFLSFIFILSILFFTIYLYLRSRITHNAYGILIFFGILWFFITLLIQMSLRGIIYEHWLYLPSIGFILSVVSSIFYGFEYLEKRVGKSLFVYLSLIILAVSFSLSLALYNRNIVWKDKITLWEDVVKKSPGKASARLHLGTAYAEQGRFDAAVREFRAVLKLEPYNIDAYYNLGNVYLDQNRLDEAVEEYLLVLKIKSNLPSAHNNLGKVYYLQDKIDDAINEYIISLKIKPDLAETHYNLGLAYWKKGLEQDAKKEFEMVLKLRPDFIRAQKAIESIK